MAKKQATAAANAVTDLTPEQKAAELATRYQELLEAKKSIEEEMEGIKEQIVNHSRTTGQHEVGGLQIVFGLGKPKFNFGNLTKKAQDQMVERLKSELPGFVTTSTALDIEAIYLEQTSNTVVYNALRANGLTVEQTETVKVQVKK